MICRGEIMLATGGMLNTPTITATVHAARCIGRLGCAVGGGGGRAIHQPARQQLRPETVVETRQRRHDGQPVQEGKIAAQDERELKRTMITPAMRRAMRG